MPELSHPINPPKPVWVRFTRFHHEDQITAGLAHHQRWDEDRGLWEIRVTAVRDTAPGFGKPFDGWLVASKVWPRDVTPPSVQHRAVQPAPPTQP